MTKPVRTPATYADLEKVPPHLVAEIIHGVLETHPRPVRKHWRAATRLGMVLGGPYDLGNGGPGGWVFADEPQLSLGPHVLVPDLAAWRVERAPVMEDVVNTDIPPDWICEILSPSTERQDRGAKMQIYADFGVAYLWLLDPRTRFLDAHQLVASRWIRVGGLTGEGDMNFPPFDATSFPLDLLFPSQPAKPGKTS
jgi:Uma2 family endonuclease